MLTGMLLFIPFAALILWPLNVIDMGIAERRGKRELRRITNGHYRD
jgi:hypothetical protein